MNEITFGPLIPQDFYSDPPFLVAPKLLGKILLNKKFGLQRSGRIVEVEAYGGTDDPASHAYKGKTSRNASMFGPPGHLYVYFTYGMHWCSNVVCLGQHCPGAVLIRALAPLSGLEIMRQNRTTVVDENLCSGPAKLSQAMGIKKDLDGSTLFDSSQDLVIAQDINLLPFEISQGRRIGISNAKEFNWRWWIKGDPNVSKGH